MRTILNDFDKCPAVKEYCMSANYDMNEIHQMRKETELMRERNNQLLERLRQNNI